MKITYEHKNRHVGWDKKYLYSGGAFSHVNSR